MLRELLQNPQWILFFLLFVAPTLASIWKQHRKTQERRQTGGSPQSGRPPQAGRPPLAGGAPGESDLERRVRENFEEILRRRRREASDTGPADPTGPRRDPVPPPRPARKPPVATAPAPSRRPASTSSRASRSPSLPPPAPGTAPVIPPAVRGPVAPANPYHVVLQDKPNADAYLIDSDRAYNVSVDAYSLERRLSRRKSAGRLVRRKDLDLESLRRAVLWKEILDAPLGLREPRDQQF